MGNREFREDVESYLWAILIESIYSFDLDGPVPFPRLYESWHHVRLHEVLEAERLRYRREIHIPDRTTDDGEVAFGMDIFASGENVADMVMSADEEHRLRARPRMGFRQTIS